MIGGDRTNRYMIVYESTTMIDDRNMMWDIENQDIAMNHAISGWVWPTGTHHLNLTMNILKSTSHFAPKSTVQRLTVPKSASGSKATFLAHHDKFTWDFTVHDSYIFIHSKKSISLRLSSNVGPNIADSQKISKNDDLPESTIGHHWTIQVAYGSL